MSWAEQLDDEPYVKTVCRVGKKGCCRYLAMDPGGFTCLKVNPELKELIDARVATMKAQGDNCEGRRDLRELT